MGATGIEYVYVETHDVKASIRFWEALSFTVGLDIEDAARMDPPDGGAGIFLEEVPRDRALSVQVYLRSPDATSRPDVPVVAGWEPSHWGSSLLQVRDPDGRVFVLQNRT